jgi:hypothetical protein
VLLRLLQRLADGQDAQLLALRADDPDLSDANALVDADFL